jgi:hypothetical protein
MKTVMKRDEALFTRHDSNPILSGKDWPHRTIRIHWQTDVAATAPLHTPAHPGETNSRSCIKLLSL